MKRVLFAAVSIFFSIFARPALAAEAAPEVFPTSIAHSTCKLEIRAPNGRLSTGVILHINHQLRRSNYSEIDYGRYGNPISEGVVVLEFEEAGYSSYNATLKYWADAKLLKFTRKVSEAAVADVMPRCQII